MNIIFLTMSRITDISQRGIYTDLMRKFRNEGHSVYIVTPNERSFGRPTELKEMNGINVLGVRTLKLQKTSVIEKGVGQVLLESQYKKAEDFPKLQLARIFDPQPTAKRSIKGCWSQPLVAGKL